MRRCAACGGPGDDGLFCRWCGQAVAVEGPRLLEALAIEIAGDVASPVIPYGARLPTSWSDVFSTAEDHQATFQLRLVVGNSVRASECRTLANLVHPLEAPGPRAGPRLQVTVHVSATGSLSIEAVEQGGQRPLSVRGLQVAVSGAGA